MPDLLERLTTALADRYAIEREIGRGGMAVVFLAEDLKHRRRVALKVLHPELTATLGAERFLQEIEIVAGLQHPHILPLYDSGEADGLLYHVMPYAEGESLRQRLDREGQLAVDETVRIAVEVADGLDYAHRKGVVHRDIKPGNILLAEGHATIADFGIARAIEAARADRVTSTGLGVGTPLYASPEQASAQEKLDGRTDIYSLGCVLYEMLGGEPPHTGATPQMILARRMSETPTALHTLRDTVPPALGHVIARALARIPADRYATASQFGQALQAALFAATPGSLATTPTAVALEPKRKVPRWVRFAVPTLGIAIVIAGTMLLISSDWLGRGPLQLTVSNITHVTSDPGVEFQPAISPDGSEVAYVDGPINNPRLVVRSTIDIGSSGGTLPGQGVGRSHWFPSWTPDGASIRFLACQAGYGMGCSWKEVGSRGGSVRTIGVPHVPRPWLASYGWSGDGTRLAFFVRDSVFIYAADRGEPELLGVNVVEEYEGGLHSPVWSPDGQRIAFVKDNWPWRISQSPYPASIWIADANGGEPVRVTDDTTINVSPQWLADSRHILFVSDRDGPRGIYVVEVGPEGPQGPPRSVLGSSDPHSISISADGRRLAYAKFTAARNIRSIPIPRAGVVSITSAVPVTTGNQIIEGHGVSPDGEWIVFNSDIRGGFDIYKQRVAGGQAQRLADISGHARNPRWSPDGTEIAFFEESGSILVVPADGGALEQLTDSTVDGRHPQWSPDGLTIAFLSVPPGAGPWSIWIVSRDRVSMPWSAPVLLTDDLRPCQLQEWAPDGNGVLCTNPQEMVQVSREGKIVWRYQLSTAGLGQLYTASFSRDGSRIYFIATPEDGSRGVWWIPATGGDATKVVAFDDPALDVPFGGLSVGPENLYLTIAEYESDIWVMDLAW